MLVLGRRRNESIIIGEDVVITILAIEGERVKIGIDAPSDVSILRQELYEAVKQENVRAMAATHQKKDRLLPSLQNLLQNKNKTD